MTSPKVLNSQLMPESSNSCDQYQFLQIVNTPIAQQNVTTCSNITKQSPSINDASNVMNQHAFDIQSPAIQTKAAAQTKRPAKHRGKEIDMSTGSANEMPVQYAIETVTNTRAKRAKTATVDVLPDQASFLPIGQSNEMNMNIQPQIDEKPKRGKRKPSKDEALIEVEEVKPKRGRQKKKEQIESSSSVAMVQEIPPIVKELVKPKRGGRRQNSITQTISSEPSSSVELVHHLQDVSQEPVKPKRGGRRQNSATETVNIEPIPEVIVEKPGRRILRKRTIDEALPAPEMAKTTRSKRNVVEPIIEVEEPVVVEKPKRVRRKAVQIEIPTVPEYIESNVEVKSTRSKRRPTIDEDIPLAQSLNVKNGNQKKVQFQDEKPTNDSQDKMSAHETSIKLDIEPVNAENKTTRKRTPKSKAVESDEAAYEAPRTRRGRKPAIEADQEPAEETKLAITRPRRAAKKS